MIKGSLIRPYIHSFVHLFSSLICSKLYKRYIDRWESHSHLKHYVGMSQRLLDSRCTM